MDVEMEVMRRRMAGVATALVLGVGLGGVAGCGSDDVDQAREEIENTANDAVNEAEDAANDAGNAAEDAANDAGNAAEDAAGEVEKKGNELDQEAGGEGK